MGGKINAGDVIADIETDKATMALESMEVGARGFHSSTFRLNLSRFYTDMFLHRHHPMHPTKECLR